MKIHHLNLRPAPGSFATISPDRVVQEQMEPHPVAVLEPIGRHQFLLPEHERLHWYMSLQAKVAVVVAEEDPRPMGLLGRQSRRKEGALQAETHRHQL